MTNDVDFHALAASAAILLLPIISTALSLGGSWFIGRRAVKRNRVLRDETQRLRDETQRLRAEARSMHRDAREHETAEFRRVSGPSGRPDENFPRHRAEVPMARQWPGRDPDDRGLSQASPVRTTTRKAGTP
ncbi:hypothetical protein [Amycolatopsis dendrobii]|uniref:Uncharacterized protein n=1 Tax=Amycolatopsis dendrobii TaxID=2760662 RepID=A0A7W3Z9U1_9PSEU|nr:hypothetical protein [Amycolatopsis dendrobii]MBB1153540.1 hypothetical protein [Amycolatopsis dendrobii]